jgi:hypothetical protein
MKYDHPTICVEEPKPGAFIISGHRPASFFIPDVGHYVPPAECYISPEIPADLLRAIADAKDGKPASEPVELLGDPAASNPNGETGAVVSLAERVCNVLADGNVRLADLAERLGVEAEDIKAVAGQGFELGHAGWVKLNAGGEA